MYFPQPHAQLPVIGGSGEVMLYQSRMPLVINTDFNLADLDIDESVEPVQQRWF